MKEWVEMCEMAKTRLGTSQEAYKQDVNNKSKVECKWQEPVKCQAEKEMSI